MDIKKFMGDASEQPLDRIIEGGGFASIFPTIACIGDSLASGELQIKDKDGNNHFFDFYQYSWGKFIEKITGSKVSVFARGGMTARAYRQSFANSMGYWRRELAANAYIIALGVNDLVNQKMEIGSIADICKEDYTKNADTYIGNYAYIIQRYKEIQPEAKFFLVTIPAMSDRSEERTEICERMCEALYALADEFDNTYVIDLFKYAPDFGEEFKRDFFLTGHMNPMGYMFLARLFVSYIDYIIRHNMQDFSMIGLMGVDKDF